MSETTFRSHFSLSILLRHVFSCCFYLLVLLYSRLAGPWLLGYSVASVTITLKKCWDCLCDVPHMALLGSEACTWVLRFVGKLLVPTQPLFQAKSCAFSNFSMNMVVMFYSFKYFGGITYTCTLLFLNRVSRREWGYENYAK